MTLFTDFFLRLADMCIAIAISLLMILICAMATYGAYKVSSFEINWAFFQSLTRVICAETCKEEDVIILSFL